MPKFKVTLEVEDLSQVHDLTAEELRACFERHDAGSRNYLIGIIGAAVRVLDVEPIS